MEGVGHAPEDTIMPREMFLLQVSSVSLYCYPMLHYVLMVVLLTLIIVLYPSGANLVAFRDELLYLVRFGFVQSQVVRAFSLTWIVLGFYKFLMFGLWFSIEWFAIADLSSVKKEWTMKLALKFE